MLQKMGNDTSILENMKLKVSVVFLLEHEILINDRQLPRHKLVDLEGEVVPEHRPAVIRHIKGE